MLTQCRIAKQSMTGDSTETPREGGEEQKRPRNDGLVRVYQAHSTRFAIAVLKAVTFHTSPSQARHAGSAIVAPHVPLMRIKLLFVLALCCMPLLARAGDASPTLRKIREAGVINIGYRDASVPFSYLDDHQHPIGYSIDICQRIVAAVKEQLGLRSLERRWVPVNSATRLPMVANGSVDLECGVTTNTAERQRQVAFSVTTFIAASRLASRRDDPIVHLSDLHHKKVTSTVGTTSLHHLQKLYSGGLEMNLIASRDDPDAFRLLEAHRVAAYAMDDVLLHATIAGSGHPNDFLVSDDALSVEPYAIVLPPHDPEFKRVADGAIVALFQSGQIQALYRKWFQSPIPPFGVNLELPMHPAMPRIIEHPTDTPDPDEYK